MGQESWEVHPGGLSSPIACLLWPAKPSDILILRSKNGEIGAEDKARLEQWIGA
jgi:hypothetical protein